MAWRNARSSSTTRTWRTRAWAVMRRLPAWSAVPTSQTDLIGGSVVPFDLPHQENRVNPRPPAATADTDSMHVGIVHAIARLLAEAPTLAEAAPELIGVAATA